MTPPTPREVKALTDLVPRWVLDAMRDDWKTGLANLKDVWLPWYGHFCWESLKPGGEGGSFTAERIRELAAAVPGGEGWDALLALEPTGQLDLFAGVA